MGLCGNLAEKYLRGSCILQTIYRKVNDATHRLRWAPLSGPLGATTESRLDRRCDVMYKFFPGIIEWKNIRGLTLDGVSSPAFCAYMHWFRHERIFWEILNRSTYVFTIFVQKTIRGVQTRHIAAWRLVFESAGFFTCIETITEWSQIHHWFLLRSKA